MSAKNPEVQRKLQREWLDRRKADFFKDKSCAKCGSVENLQLARLDKTDPPLRGFHSLSKAKQATIRYQVLCSECGKIDRLASRPVVHGTEWKYQRDGCRCAACVKAASTARQARRNRNK